MLLDDSRFPLVFLRAHEEPGSSIEEQLERNREFETLLDREMPFVLIADHPEHDHDDETSEQRKAKALFFKRMKDRMSRYCLGLIVIVIEGDTPINTAARIAAAGVSKALGFSVQFAADEQSAAVKGMALLEKHGAAPAPSVLSSIIGRMSASSHIK